MRYPGAWALLVSLVPIGISIAGAEPAIRPGDHIAIIGNTYADQLRIHGYLETLLRQRTQGNPVSIRNLGWGGDTLSIRERPTNFPSEESALLAHKTDVIVICFGMGESYAGKAGLSDFRGHLKRIIAAHKGKKYNGESMVRIALVSPIAHEDHGELSRNRKQRNKDLADYVGAMQQVASAEDVPFVDLYAPTLYLMGIEDSSKLTEQGIHLNAYGYWATGRMVADKLLPGQPTWWFSVDAKSLEATARGAKVSGVKQQGRGLRFSVEEGSPPSLSPPAEGKIHDNLAATRDTLVVSNLVPGQYLLTVDGQPVAEGSHQRWAEGVPVDSSPAHLQLEDYRERVNDKNLQFTYSWKALNQVHIVGERKASPSGRSLPAEIIEFNELATGKEKKLGITIKPRTSEWILVPE